MNLETDGNQHRNLGHYTILALNSTAKFKFSTSFSPYPMRLESNPGHSTLIILIRTWIFLSNTFLLGLYFGQFEILFLEIKDDQFYLN